MSQDKKSTLPALAMAATMMVAQAHASAQFSDIKFRNATFKDFWQGE